jgi:CRP-like cAMP-binding protein
VNDRIKKTTVLSAFKNYIKKRVNITDEEWQMIQSVSILKKLHKKQYLLQETDVWKHYAFVVRGCLRTYAVDGMGNEHIVGFAIENWWAGDRESLLTGLPSKLNVDAIEESEVLLIKKEDFKALCKEIPAVNEMVMGIMEKSVIASQNRVQVAISFTAREKYLHFADQYPDFVRRIPQHMIASYLGISAETLSRIRKRESK